MNAIPGLVRQTLTIRRPKYLIKAFAWILGTDLPGCSILRIDNENSGCTVWRRVFIREGFASAVSDQSPIRRPHRHMLVSLVHGQLDCLTARRRHAPQIPSVAEDDRFSIGRDRRVAQPQRRLRRRSPARRREQGNNKDQNQTASSETHSPPVRIRMRPPQGRSRWIVSTELGAEGLRPASRPGACDAAVSSRIAAAMHFGARSFSCTLPQLRWYSVAAFGV